MIHVVLPAYNKARILLYGRYPVIAREVPLVLRYDKKVGESKMKVARTVLETLDLIKTRLFEQS